MTMSKKKGYHIVIKSLAHCTSKKDVMAVFHIYGMRNVAIQRNRLMGSHAFLMFISLDSAGIAFHLQEANDICLHAQKLKLQYPYFYNKIVIASPVGTKQQHTWCYLLKLFQKQ